MEIPLITALISAASVVLVAVLTYSFSKRREQEVEWRKLKLEHYQTFMSALSNTVGSRSTSDSQARYADAVNKLRQCKLPLKVDQSKLESGSLFGFEGS